MQNVCNQLETITEKHPAEEDAIAMSQQVGTFYLDIEASHSFSLRNYGKDKASTGKIDNVKSELEDGKGSELSNYSKIYGNVQQQRSQRDLNASMLQGLA